MSSQLGRHGLGQIRINDSNIRSDIEVSQRIFNALVIIGNYGERGHLGGSAGGGRNRQEFRFLTQSGESKRSDQVFKLSVRILIKSPHSLRGVNRRTAADRNDPVRLEFLHGLGALHNGFYRRIRLNAFEQHSFNAGLVQIVDNLV